MLERKQIKVSGYQTLTDNINIFWDASLGNIAQVTLAGDRTLNFPTNLKGTQNPYFLIVKQDVVGGRTLFFDESILFPGNLNLNTSPNSLTCFKFVYDGVNLINVDNINYLAGSGLSIDNGSYKLGIVTEDTFLEPEFTDSTEFHLGNKNSGQRYFGVYIQAQDVELNADNIYMGGIDIISGNVVLKNNVTSEVAISYDINLDLDLLSDLDLAPMIKVNDITSDLDSLSNTFASETVRGFVEEATTAEILANTDTGSTGAKLFVPPSKLSANYISKLLEENKILIGNSSGQAEAIDTQGILAGTRTLVNGSTTLIDVSITTSSVIMILPSILGRLTGILRATVNNGNIVIESRDATNTIITGDSVTFMYLIIL